MSNPSKMMRRQILSLALPALGSLLTEPLLTFTDSALVGHLGTAPLAGLALGATIMNFVVGACIFLAYTSTALSGRARGRGDEKRAYLGGLQGIWLGLGLGAGIAGALFWLAPVLCGGLADGPVVAAEASAYVRYSAWGLPAMLAVLAANGLFRAFRDTKRPLVIAVVGSLVNIPLSFGLIYGCELGISGAAVGTSLAQTLMLVLLLGLLARRFHREGLRFCLHFELLRELGFCGAPLVVRSLCLQAMLLFTTFVAARFGEVVLASYQVVKTVWSLLAYSLDALAIAAQILVAEALGRGDGRQLRGLFATLDRWGMGAGGFLGVFFMLLSPVLPAVFTADSQVASLSTTGLLVVGSAQFLAALTFMYDGYLIGAADNRYLAKAMLFTALIYCATLGACCFVLLHWMPLGSWWASAGGATVVIWFCYGFISIGLRFITLKWRANRIFTL